MTQIIITIDQEDGTVQVQSPQASATDVAMAGNALTELHSKLSAKEHLAACPVCPNNNACKLQVQLLNQLHEED